MKIKVYPLKNYQKPVDVLASSFLLHLEIICASLSKGVSTIKNLVDSNDIDCTIEWCENIGANIKKIGDHLVVKGNNNSITIKNSLFNCHQSILTPKLMIPLLATVSQPIGIKCSSKILNEISFYKNMLVDNGGNFYDEKEEIRIEKGLHPLNTSFEGSVDVSLMAGLFMALPLLNESSIIKLLPPIAFSEDYNCILKLLKKFNIEIRHSSSSLNYEISGGQRYKHKAVVTEMDAYNVCLLSTLSSKFEGVSISKFYGYMYQNNYRLWYLCKHHICAIKGFKIKRFKKRNYTLNKLDASLVENSLPFLFLLATLNKKNDTVISKIKLEDKKIQKQCKTMEVAFVKLGLDASRLTNELVIHHGKVMSKVQVDCNDDPYVVMALSYLALLSDYPIIIKNAECINNFNKEFIHQMVSFGAKIEIIHD